MDTLARDRVVEYAEPRPERLTPIYRWNGGHYSEVLELVESIPPREQRFEQFVDALLKVDPKGLSGKHRRKEAPLPVCKRCHKPSETISSRGLCRDCGVTAMDENMDRLHDEAQARRDQPPEK